jgi:hypothetical protein
LRVLPVGLLLTHSLAADLGGVAYAQLKMEFAQQTLEPAGGPLASIPRHTLSP